MGTGPTASHAGIIGAAEEAVLWDLFIFVQPTVCERAQKRIVENVKPEHCSARVRQQRWLWIEILGGSAPKDWQLGEGNCIVSIVRGLAIWKPEPRIRSDSADVKMHLESLE